MPILLKTRILDKKDRYRSFVREDIQKHPEMRIVDEYFDDCGREVDSDTPDAYHHEVVYAKNDNGMFYLGPLDSAYRKIDMCNFRTSTPTQRSGVAAVGKVIGEEKWCGWSHRAKVCFEKGDRVFDPSYGDERTIFKEHGYAIIEDEKDMIEAASRFAQYVS
jgi:co-chaperonin GroES (HSP10)